MAKLENLSPENIAVIDASRPAEFKVLHDALANYAKTNPVNTLDVITALQYLLIDIDNRHVIYFDGQPMFEIIPDDQMH